MWQNRPYISPPYTLRETASVAVQTPCSTSTPIVLRRPLSKPVYPSRMGFPVNRCRRSPARGLGGIDAGVQPTWMDVQRSLAGLHRHRAQRPEKGTGARIATKGCQVFHGGQWRLTLQENGCRFGICRRTRELSAISARTEPLRSLGTEPKQMRCGRSGWCVGLHRAG